MFERRSRRSVLSGGAAAVCALAGCVSDLAPDLDGPGGTGRSPDWRMHRNGPANTGVYPGEIATAEAVETSWTFESDERFRVPTVVEDTVYIYGEESLYAVDIADEAERWTTEIGLASLRAPAVADGLVYAGSGEGLFALDTETGEEEWAQEGAMGIAPVVADGTVYATGRGGPVFAFDASTGETLWETPRLEEATLLSTPAHSDGTVFLATAERGGGTERGTVRAIDAADGARRWEVETEGVAFSAPAVHDETLFVPANTGTVYAFDVDDGTERWSRDTGDVFTCPPTVGAETVYVASQEGTLYALDASDGAERWSSGGFGFVNTGAALAGDTLFVAGSNELSAVDVESGEENWHVRTDLNLMGPIVADGTIFATVKIARDETPSEGYAGRLYAFAP